MQKTLTILNIIIPLFNGAFSIFYGIILFEKGDLPSIFLGAIWVLSTYLVGLLQANSGVCLLFALIKIKAVLRQGMKAENIN